MRRFMLLIAVLMLAIGLQAQLRVTGKIIAQDGTLLPGTSVTERNTNNVTIANQDAMYAITVAGNNAELVISYTGYATQTVKVNGRSVIDITLSASDSSLDQVVVIGYGSQRKRDLTGAIARVKSEDFAPGTNSNAAQLLTGAAPGVVVSQTSSAPGSGMKVQIRGAGSINSSNDVLFVVDGLPGVDPSSLSPGDIESIEVLKDASAAAIYGTRAANGVVLVTTRKGKGGTPTLSYSAYYGQQSVATRLDVLGASDYMKLVNLRSVNRVYTDQQIASAGAGTDWQNEIFQTAPIQNHQLSLSGGGDKGNYYMGLNYFNQQGIVQKSGDKKYNFRLNVSSRPFRNLQISSNINFTRENIDEILFSNAANDFAGPLNTAIQFDPSLPTGLNDQGRYYSNATIALDNPVALIKGITNNTVSSRFYGSVSADYTVIENLTATIRLGAEANSSRSDFYRDRSTQLGFANGGIANVSSGEYSHWLAEYIMKYQKTFGRLHDFSILGGATFEEFLSRGLGANGAGFLSDVTYSNLLQSGDGALRDDISSSKFKNQLNGFIGRATYGFDGKYLLTASFRVDGSSRFSDKYKYAFFPSASLGWRISEENFLRDINWLNELKFRIGYGQLGNQGINNFETRQTLVAGGNAVFGGIIYQGVLPARLPNPDLRWETTSEINAGFDYGFFNNRIEGTIDYFKRTTRDQLFVKPLPSATGFTAVRTNIGAVENRGIELGLTTKNFVGKFGWKTTINLSFLQNEVTELPDFTQEIISGNVGTFISNYLIVKEGAPLRSFYGYEINGIFQKGDDIANAAKPRVNGYGEGMPKFVDQNGDKVIDEKDRVILGDPFPDLTFGINNVFTYKGLSFSFYINGVQGIETLDANVTESIYPTNSARNSISKYFINRWTADNPSNIYPIGSNPSLYGGARTINSLTVLDASFARLRNVTLGYEVPLKSSKVLRSFSVYVSADNLYTLTNFEGYDPDASASGSAVSKVNYNSYPLAKTIRFGGTINF